MEASTSVGWGFVPVEIVLCLLVILACLGNLGFDDGLAHLPPVIGTFLSLAIIGLQALLYPRLLFMTAARQGKFWGWASYVVLSRVLPFMYCGFHRFCVNTLIQPKVMWLRSVVLALAASSPRTGVLEFWSLLELMFLMFVMTPVFTITLCWAWHPAGAFDASSGLTAVTFKLFLAPVPRWGTTQDSSTSSVFQKVFAFLQEILYFLVSLIFCINVGAIQMVVRSIWHVLGGYTKDSIIMRRIVKPSKRGGVEPPSLYALQRMKFLFVAPLILAITPHGQAVHTFIACNALSVAGFFVGKVPPTTEGKILTLTDDRDFSWLQRWVLIISTVAADVLFTLYSDVLFSSFS